MYTSAVVLRPVHLCPDTLSTHIGTVLSAQYYVSSVVWCAGALHTTLLLLARSHSRGSCLTLHDTLLFFSKLLAHLVCGCITHNPAVAGKVAQQRKLPDPT
jgi:hypothetical protein